MEHCYYISTLLTITLNVCFQILPTYITAHTGSMLHFHASSRCTSNFFVPTAAVITPSPTACYLVILIKNKVVSLYTRQSSYSNYSSQRFFFSKWYSLINQKIWKYHVVSTHFLNNMAWIIYNLVLDIYLSSICLILAQTILKPDSTCVCGHLRCVCSLFRPFGHQQCLLPPNFLRLNHIPQHTFLYIPPPHIFI